MKGKLKIFYVSSEVSPFTQTGGLADVSGALSKILKNMGHDIRLMMPNYKFINERKYILRDVIRLQGLEIKIGDQLKVASAKSAFIPDSKVQIYFLDNKFFFERDGLYCDRKTGQAFADNAERFTFFSIGCLETLKLLHWQPDIIHCNDWQTAIIPVLLKSKYKDDAFFKNTRTLLSIQNFDEQGSVDYANIENTGILDLIYPSSANYTQNSHFNFLQAGLENADLINTAFDVVPNDVGKRSEKNDNVAAILTARKKDVFSISNGVDENIWDPEKDKLIPFNYNKRDISNKHNNKKELLQLFGLEYNPKIPVICTHANFTDSESVELFNTISEELAKMEVQLLALSDSEQSYHKKIMALQKKRPKKIVFKTNLDFNLVHSVVAGSDLFLSLSQNESGYINQFNSLVYGTIPVVSIKAANAGSIENFDPQNKSGNGFVYTKFNAKTIISQIKNAVKNYQNQELWSIIVQNAMKAKFSWQTSAHKYVKLYQKLMSLKSTRN
ncbi:MAG: glycogen synthase [bacterium]